jgi:hypothetical protein
LVANPLLPMLGSDRTHLRFKPQFTISILGGSAAMKMAQPDLVLSYEQVDKNLYMNQRGQLLMLDKIVARANSLVCIFNYNQQIQCSFESLEFCLKNYN